MADKGIYVEAFIRSGLDEVWHKTQDPALHQQWDLRFSTISYQPKNPLDPRGDAQPQRFDYETRIGFGLAVRGGGESLGQRSRDAESTSALRFWSNDPKSLIREGSGYWKYVEQTEGILFFTWYDYTPRFGVAGRLFNWGCFRPLMGWATAWSFDRLRLWIEQATPPGQTLAWTLVYTLCRLTIVAVWVWHGLVPKLLLPQHDEVFLLTAQGMSGHLLPLIGILEVLFGLVGLVLWRWRPYFVLNVAAMVAALASVALTAPVYLAHAFNPLTLNAAVAALALAGFMAKPYAAFASRCRREPAKETTA